MMDENNVGYYDNASYTFFGPVDMAFHDDGVALDDSDSIKVTVSTLLGIAMILSIIGNVCTCAVIARNRSMWTPTNCYLFNLAVTDLMIALFVPIEVYMLWIPHLYPLGEEGCLIHSLLLDCLCYCNVLTICEFTVERYLVVSKPFLRQKLSLKSRVLKIIAINWVIACSSSIPYIFYVDVLEGKKHAFCSFTLPLKLRVLLGIQIFVFYIFPMAIICVIYTLIVVKLKSTQLKSKSSLKNGHQNMCKVVKMLAAVAASFFSCWSPYCALRIMMAFPQFSYEDYYNVWRVLNYVCLVNGFASTAINPILYSLMSRKFRKAFKDFLKGRSQCQATLTPNTIAGRRELERKCFDETQSHLRI